MSSDMRLYETYYGIHTNHWDFSFGDFSNWNKILVSEYIDDACLTTDESAATSSDNIFVYQNHIAKTYFIEGVITGQFCLVASGATSTVTSFMVTVGKINVSGERTDLFTTDWRTVNDTLIWDTSVVTAGVGDERVYWFQIDAWEQKKIDQYDRIYLKIEVNSDNNCVLSHINGGEFIDVMVTIPFMGI